jgi:ABC-type dipeptide/oligopeptide/nickel transport system ATPase component
MAEDAVLEIRDLAVAYPGPAGDVVAVQDINLDLHRGEIVGLVGESGSGKSTLAFGVMRLLKNGAHIVRGEVRVAGQNIYQLEGETLRDFRWKTIAMVFQSAMNALNPVLTIGEQIIDTIQSHEDSSREKAKERAYDLLRMVRIDPARLSSYPHELSGGMRQRVMIAIAVANAPELLIADEPTTALDVTTQAQILGLLDELKSTLNMGIILITHDLGVVAGHADRVMVMYAGRIVERATTGELFHAMRHPYTFSLFSSIPRI